MDSLKHCGINLILVLLGVLTGYIHAGAAPDAGQGELIPDLFVSMREGDRPAYALIVEKSSQQITLFKYDGQYQVVDTMQCSTGKARGDKRVSGDKKTPVGAYFVTREFNDRELAPLYGTRAFPLDYPNFMDQRQGRNGYAIWMHGTNRTLIDRDSNGCIALMNQDIDKLSAYIALKDTPILITDKVNYKPSGQAASEDAAIRTFLSRWNNALAKRSYHAYLAFYDPGYLPDISWWMQWRKIRNPGPQTMGSIGTRLDFLGIYKHRELFVAIFDQQLSVDGVEAVAGRRKIFISFKSGDPLIVGDTFIASESVDQKAAAVYPLVLATRELRSRHTGDGAIGNLVDRWLAAWTGKDINAYGACYSDNFRSKQMDLQMWLAYKERLNKAYRYIHVSGENIKIRRDGGTATVTLLQTYESSAHKAQGMKTLILKMEDGKWKIFRETYRRK
ncbi:MAG: L,D-transpeptidase family protein [Desulfobacterales bacterium]|nr:L,D-transpeptidase family protein [Desulfobacterales bacterium]